MLVIAILYLLLVVFLVIFCGTLATTFDEFSKYCGLFATIVGVTTGAIPSFFFHREALKANQKAGAAGEQKNQAELRALDAEKQAALATARASTAEIQAQITIQQAVAAEGRAQKAADHAQAVSAQALNAMKRAEIYAGALPQDVAGAIRMNHPEIFQ